MRYDEEGEGFEPTIRADVSFGQWTMPLQRVTPDGPLTPGRAFAQPFFVATKPPPAEELPAPLIAPPPSASRAIAIGFMIGTSLGLALLGGAWHFFL